MRLLRSFQINRAVEISALLLILASATIMAGYRLDEPPWEPGHHGYLLSQWPHYARNYLRYGYIATRLSPVETDGLVDSPNGLQHRNLHHPVLMPLLISFSQAIFGIHEYSARLVPVLFSVALVMLVYLLTRRLAGPSAGLLAAFFAAFVPIRTYYGRLPDPSTLAAFFVFLTLVLYFYWLERPHRWVAVAFWISLTMGFLSDWLGYTVIPAIVLHYLLVGRKRRWRPLFLASLAIVPFAAFALYVVWTYALSGEAAVDVLVSSFFFRALSRGKGGRFFFTPLEYWLLARDRALRFFTAQLLALGLVWVGMAIRRAVRRRRADTDLAVITTLLPALSYNLAFNNQSFIHEYLMYPLIPFVSMAAGMGAMEMIRWSQRWHRVWGVVALFIITYLFTPQAVSTWYYLNQKEIDPTPVVVGMTIGQASKPDATVLTSSSIARDRRLRYYLDRQWRVVQTLGEMKSALADGNVYTHYLLDSESKIPDDLRLYLASHYQVIHIGDFSIFDLQSERSSTFVERPSIQHPADVTFGDLRFLGYSIDPPVVERQPRPTLWERYLNRHTARLPERRTAARITYYWQALAPLSGKYEFVASLMSEVDDTYRLDLSHIALGGAVPPAVWPTDHIIAESYAVEIPLDYLDMHYHLWLGVKHDETDMEPTAGAEVRKNRAYIGSILVVPRERWKALTELPEIENEGSVSPVEGLTFRGYNVIQSGRPTTIKTYWECTSHVREDLSFYLIATSGQHVARHPIDLPPTSRLQSGYYYAGQTLLHPYLLPARYDLSVEIVDHPRLDSHQISLGSLSLRAERLQPLLTRIGVADGRQDPDVPTLSHRKTRSIIFSLDHPEAVRLIIGWTGQSQFQEPRLEVYITNDVWLFEPKYVTTLSVRQGYSGTSQVEIPASLTVSGENTIELRVSQMGESYVGWRRIVTLIVPQLEGLLTHGYLRYWGWIRPDFIGVRSAEWNGDAKDYERLIGFYQARGMPSEAVFLYARAFDQGLLSLDEISSETLALLGQHYMQDEAYARAKEVYELLIDRSKGGEHRVEKAALLEALLHMRDIYEALGEEVPSIDIGSLIAELVPNTMDVDLGGKVRFLGWDVIQPEEGATEIQAFFQCLEEMDTDYRIWVHAYPKDPSLLDEERQEYGFAGLDHDPSVPTGELLPGGIYMDTFEAKLPAGQYQIRLGFWERESGSRLKTPQGSMGVSLGWVEVK